MNWSYKYPDYARRMRAISMKVRFYIDNPKYLTLELEPR